MEDFAHRAAGDLAAIRAKRPLVHTLTNRVAVNYTANALLAMGASPIMAHAGSEVEEIADIADALVLNIGTLSEDRTHPMLRAAKKMNALGKPVVFDPVGSGASTFRTFFARRIVEEIQLFAIRGNASEIVSLGGEPIRSKGVDAAHGVADALAAAKRLAETHRTVCAVTGPVDIITDGHRILQVENGHPLMARMTGSGCAATAVLAAFAAVDPSPLPAAAGALSFFGLAGEIAGRRSAGPGSFMIELLDALYALAPETLIQGCRIIAPDDAGSVA